MLDLHWPNIVNVRWLSVGFLFATFDTILIPLKLLYFDINDVLEDSKSATLDNFLDTYLVVSKSKNRYDKFKDFSFDNLKKNHSFI